MLILDKSRHIRYFFFFCLYFSQGIPSGFAFTALFNHLTAQGIDVQALSNFALIISLPWSIKFIWGPITDRFQDSLMGRKRPWILLAQSLCLLISLAMLMIKDPVKYFYDVMIIFALQEIFLCLQDVCADAMAIIIVPLTERGRVNASMKCGTAAGQAVGAAGFAYIIQQYGFQMAAIWQSISFLIITILTILIRERPNDKLFSTKEINFATEISIKTSFIILLKRVLGVILNLRNIIFFGAVACIFISIRIFQRDYHLYLIKDLKWNELSISLLSGGYGTMLGVMLAIVGGSLSDYIGAKRMLIITAIVICIFQIIFSLNINSWKYNEIATIGLMVRQVLEIIFSIAALPVIMSLCQRGVEGAQFSIYMALINQADLLGVYLSGILFSNYSLSFIGIGCGLIVLIALIVIKIVRISAF